MGDSSEPMHDPVLAADQSPAPAPEDPQTMHVHKIKPVHGWREFASEIMVIVIGIVIAIGGEQVVEWSHIRNQTSRKRRELLSEPQFSRGNRWQHPPPAPNLKTRA
jgi:hypothetical protein